MQMRKTAEALRRADIEVAESFDPEPRTNGFDLAHVFNLRTIDATRKQVAALGRQGVPVVMSPIYLDPSVALWAARVTRDVFGQARTRHELEGLLRRFATRELSVKTAGGQVIASHAGNRPRARYDEEQRGILAGVRRLLPNSYMEMAQLMRTLHVSDMPFTVVRYAVDSNVFLDPDPGPFVDRYGLTGFVLQAGRIEFSKNQLLLVYALRDLDLPVVLIGGSLQQDYLLWCREHGPPGLLIVDHLSPEELRAAYAAARVQALPSWIETCGLVNLEAALADCAVVASTAGYEVEYLREFAHYCDPADVQSIRRMVVAAFEGYDRDAPRRAALKKLILEEYTWDRAAADTLAAYHATLEESGG